MKKITKRIISIITAMAMTMAMGITAFADYSDLPKDHWAYDTVMTLSDEGAFSGYEDGTFKPDNTITHEEFLSAVIRILGIPTTPVDKDYVQVETDDMYNPQYWTNRWAAWAQPFLNAALSFNDDALSTGEYSFIDTEKYKYDALVRKDANTGTFIETLTDDTDLAAVNTPITRKEAAKLLRKITGYMGLIGFYGEKYTDARYDFMRIGYSYGDDTHNWAYADEFDDNFIDYFGDEIYEYEVYYKPIVEAVAYGIMTGYPDQTFRPNASITRAEAAATLARLTHLDLRVYTDLFPYYTNRANKAKAEQQ